MNEGDADRTVPGGEAAPEDRWGSGDAYEPYVGRWSRLVAAEFLAWLDAPRGGRWIDVGCGTGALTEAILHGCAPGAVVAVDRSPDYVEWASRNLSDARVRFGVADATDLPPGVADVAVSGLVLNFLPDPAAAVAAMRAAAPAGTVAAYVWDYAGGMELMRRFWDAAVALDPAAAPLDEGTRFPLCRPEALEALWIGAGLAGVAVRPIDVPTVFRNFDDYWTPFLGGQGPAPGYAAALGEEQRSALREALRAQLPSGPDGSIALTARAWAVRGTSG